MWRALWAGASLPAIVPKAARKWNWCCPWQPSQWKRKTSMTAMPAPEMPRQLLIIEDDAAFAKTLARSFERRGYQVWVAAGPEEAAAVLQQHTPGYAVVDLKL